MGLEKNNQQGTLTARGEVHLGSIPFNLTVTDQVIAKSDPELLVSMISCEVGRIVDGLMDSLPTREQLLDYVFERVSGDFTEVYQLPIENPYREEEVPYDNSSINLAAFNEMVQENYLPLIKAEFESANKFMEKLGVVHPVSKGQHPNPLVVSQAAKAAMEDLQHFKFVPPDDFYPGKSAFSPLIPVPGIDLYAGHLNSPYGLFEVIVDPSIPKNQIRVGLEAYKGLETFSKPLNDVHEQYQKIIQKLQYDQPVKFVVESNDPFQQALAQKTAKILNNENNHWWKKKGGKK